MESVLLSSKGNERQIYRSKIILTRCGERVFGNVHRYLRVAFEHADPKLYILGRGSYRTIEAVDLPVKVLYPFSDELAKQ